MRKKGGGEIHHLSTLQWRGRESGMENHNETEKEVDIQEMGELDYITEKEYRELKRKLQKIIHLKHYMWYVCAFMGLSCAVIYFKSHYEQSDIALTLITSIGMGMFCGIFVTSYINIMWKMFEYRIEGKILDYEANRVQRQTPEDIFENTIKMSYTYLNQYYLQTKEQAQKGFFITVTISIFGAILIAVGIGAMFIGKVHPSYVACASGIIVEFISSIFFYLYNKTVVSMSDYHNKLVLSHNISIALKVSDALPDEDKAKTKEAIVNELLKDINSYLIRNDSKSE